MREILIGRSRLRWKKNIEFDINVRDFIVIRWTRTLDNSGFNLPTSLIHRVS